MFFFCNCYLWSQKLKRINPKTWHEFNQSFFHYFNTFFFIINESDNYLLIYQWSMKHQKIVKCPSHFPRPSLTSSKCFILVKYITFQWLLCKLFCDYFFVCLWNDVQYVLDCLNFNFLTCDIICIEEKKNIKAFIVSFLSHNKFTMCPHWLFSQ